MVLAGGVAILRTIYLVAKDFGQTAHDKLDLRRGGDGQRDPQHPGESRWSWEREGHRPFPSLENKPCACQPKTSAQAKRKIKTDRENRLIQKNRSCVRCKSLPYQKSKLNLVPDFVTFYAFLRSQGGQLKISWIFPSLHESRGCKVSSRWKRQNGM